MATKTRARAYASLDAYLDDWGLTGKTQSEFATSFGISVGYLSDLKHGKVQPSLTLAKRLSDECRIPIEAFLVNRISE